MQEFLKWLASTPVLAEIVVSTVTIVLLTMGMIYLVAFFQGRSISFWPPKIGAKPAPLSNISDSVHKDKDETEASRTFQSINLPISNDSMLLTASGKKLRLTTLLHAGARANIYSAVYEDSKEIAVKIYWRGLAPSSVAWMHFEQEIKLAERLEHTNIVKVLDKGIFNGYPFLVMESMKGGTLRDQLRHYNRLPGPVILSIAKQVALAIDFAHAKGVVHRDIKPDNILFESDLYGRVALSDFGIAQILGAVDVIITASSGDGVMLEGTPAYLAPEILKNGIAEPASDIYSFGVVLYEMIASSRPFSRINNVYVLFMRKLESPPPDIRRVREDVPEVISERLYKTLSIDPRERPSSAYEVLVGIEKAIMTL